MVRKGLLPIAAICLVLIACMSGKPPADFHPEAAAQPDPSDPQCPDLDGSYDLAGSPLAKAITDRAPPDSHGLPILLTFKRGVTSTEAWWVVPRDRLLEWAATERESNPAAYARWRDLVLRGKLAGERAWDRDGYRDAVAELGPPAPVFAGIVRYACEENWMRTRPQPSTYRADADGDIHETEIWLARDRSGDLLVKNLVLGLKAFHVWGDATSYLRTSGQASWSRIPVQPHAPAERLTEADLPEATASGLADALSVPTSCSEMPARLVELSNYILGNSPAGVALAFFGPLEEEEQSMNSPPHCRGQILELHFSGDSPETLASIDGILMGETLVRSVSVLVGDDDKPGLRKLRVVLKQRDRPGPLSTCNATDAPDSLRRACHAAKG